MPRQNHDVRAGEIPQDRDTDSNGTLDEQFYFLADANWNVTAVIDTSGAVQERIDCTPCGQLQFLALNSGLRGANSCDVRYTYTSREWTPEIARC